MRFLARGCNILPEGFTGRACKCYGARWPRSILPHFYRFDTHGDTALLLAPDALLWLWIELPASRRALHGLSNSRRAIANWTLLATADPSARWRPWENMLRPPADRTSK